MLVLLGTFAGLIAAGVTPAAASTLNGVATITNPVNSRPLTSGGSAAQFTVTLPAASGVPAHCTGDTAKGGYLVFSYMVHAGTSPTSVSFVNGFPSAGYGFVNNLGNYYGKVNTAVKTGQIVEIPNDLEFAALLKRVTLDDLLYAAGNKSGAWDAGIACAKNGKVSDYWNTPVDFTASTTDPNGFVWSTSCSPEPAVFHSAASARFLHGKTNKFSVVVTGCPAPVLTESGKLPTGVTLSKTGADPVGQPVGGRGVQVRLPGQGGHGQGGQPGLHPDRAALRLDGSPSHHQTGGGLQGDTEGLRRQGPVRVEQHEAAVRSQAELGRGAVGHRVEDGESRVLPGGVQGDRPQLTEGDRHLCTHHQGRMTV